MSLSSKHSDEDDSLQMDLLLNYELCEEIGRGGSAIVYSAKCKRGRLRNRVVALKKINIPANPKAVIPIAHLKSSTKLHQSLFHPSVVSLLSVFSTHYAQFHVLEHCPHGTLMSRVKRPPLHRLSEPELRGVLKGLVDGLLYLRKELVIHRDIKPSNILISTDWRVKIADFGLAVRVESESSTVVDSCGTPHYKSPQLVAEQPYGFETDLWSLGALIVTCLTGVHPFYAASVAKMNSKITRAEYALPSSLSYEVRDLVAGLLQIDRNKRTPLHHILSHPFFSSSLPFIPLHFNIPHLTLTQATPSQSNIRQAVPPALMPSNPRYPQHLSKVATPPTFTSDPKDFGLPTRTSSVRKPIQSRRNFLSDTWQPRQTPLITLPYRRIVSVPTSASDSTSKSSFLALKREDIKARRTTPNSNNPESVCLASQSAKSSSLVPDVGFRTPALTTDSDSDPPSAAPGSGSGSDSDSELESRSRSRSRSALRLGSRLLLLEPKAQERRKLNPLLTLDMAKQAVMDLENLSELAAELSSMKATKLLVPPSPSSLSSSVGASSLVVPIKQASEDLRNSDDAKSAFEAGFTSTRSLKSYQDEPGQSFKRVSSSRPAEIRDNAASSSSRAQPSSSLPGRFPPQMQDARSPVQLASDRVPGGLCKLFPALPARPSLEISGKPIRLNTEYLVCQTQKVLKGQVTVLPSKSLLVDLREGERRKGRKGDEVLVVSPDGETIKVYSAPHLSTPCCLAEPSAEYTFDLLPREYWNRYSDAGKVVSQLKQRIPRTLRSSYRRLSASTTLRCHRRPPDVRDIEVQLLSDRPIPAFWYGCTCDTDRREN
ncbi:kinase-like domain-containing protein [Cytidiella melzeri]|nr:kinase-like domain-containing protein [Cytidiella melzeri]